jgi:branched-chain amino acid transport system ATP-binding protein
MKLLSVERLNKSFGGVVAASDVSFALERGEMLALIGPNGAGKSTTFNMVGGQLLPDSGEVMLDGEKVTGLPPRDMFRRGVGRTFQVAQTFSSMSVVENVQMALIAHRGGLRRFFRPARELHRSEALGLLARVGMVEDLDRPCSTLAYGDVKRVELAIALASQPKLLLMDEPTAGMAPAERGDLMRLTGIIARAEGIGVLFTEHDMGSVFAHADRILVLVRGEIIAAGTPREVSRDERVRTLYLGTSGVAAASEAMEIRGGEGGRR